MADDSVSSMTRLKAGSLPPPIANNIQRMMRLRFLNTLALIELLLNSVYLLLDRISSDYEACQKGFEGPLVVWFALCVLWVLLAIVAS